MRKRMLEAALQAELETIERYIKRRKQAEDVGEPGLAAEFDTLLSDESNIATNCGKCWLAGHNMQ